MEALKAELEAKSLYIKSLDKYLFFSWDLFATSDRYGITIDAHALMDRARNMAEVVKLIYLCMVKYSDTAKTLKMECQQAPNMKEIEAWMALRPDEAEGAMRYISEQIYGQSKKKARKSPSKSQSESSGSRPLSRWTQRLWRRFSCGNVKGDFSNVE